MKTAIALCCSALLGVASIGCSNADYGKGSANSDTSYGTPSTAGNTIPGSQNTGSNSSAATPREPNQTPGVNPSNGASNGPTVNTGQGNSNTQDAVSPTK